MTYDKKPRGGYTPDNEEAFIMSFSGAAEVVAILMAKFAMYDGMVYNMLGWGCLAVFIIAVIFCDYLLDEYRRLRPLVRVPLCVTTFCFAKFMTHIADAQDAFGTAFTLVVLTVAMFMLSVSFADIFYVVPGRPINRVLVLFVLIGASCAAALIAKNLATKDDTFWWYHDRRFFDTAAKILMPFTLVVVMRFKTKMMNHLPAVLLRAATCAFAVYSVVLLALRAEISTNWTYDHEIFMGYAKVLTTFLAVMLSVTTVFTLLPGSPNKEERE